jgi:hypothetical protein
VNDKHEHIASEETWAEFLSSGARLRDTDLEATNRVLSAIKLERAGVEDGSSWAKFLSDAAQLSPDDAAVTSPVLQAVRLERGRVHRWRVNVTRFVAGAAVAAAVIAAVAVFSPATSADPSDAYSAYQEAARGW